MKKILFSLFLILFEISSGVSSKSADENISVENAKSVNEKSSVKSENKTSTDKNVQTKNSEADNNEKAVEFKNGDFISKQKVMEKVSNISDTASKKISFSDAKNFIIFTDVLMKLILTDAQRLNIASQKNISNLIEQKKLIQIVQMYMDQQADELMTDEALKQHSNKMWEKDLKGKQEYKTFMIMVPDKNTADKISQAQDLASAKKIAQENSAAKSMEMEYRLLEFLPKEVANVIKEKGPNIKTPIGPFMVNKSYMFCFVLDRRDLKKIEFNKEFATRYKEVARYDFIKQIEQTVLEKNKVQAYDQNGKKVDLLVEDSKNEKNKLRLVSAKDDVILVKYGNSHTITVRDLKKHYNIDSLDNEQFRMVAESLGLRIERVILFAARTLAIYNIILSEAKANKYLEDPKLKEIMKKIEEAEIIKSYLKTVIKVNKEDIRNAHSGYLKIIPEEEKNSSEISIKLLFFQTQEDASKVLKAINSGEQSFSKLYKEREESKDKTALDVGYVNRRNVSKELWDIINNIATGTCGSQVVEMEGNHFGASGNYAIIYVGDKQKARPLPVNAPQIKELAEKQKMLKYVKTMIRKAVTFINGQPTEKFLDDPNNIKMLLLAVNQLSTQYE
jgi:hypothetical protein